MAQPADWLGAFIEDEIRSVLAWKHELATVKPDPDSRFSDDGSNFRSELTTWNFPSESKVQISQILSVVEPVPAFITDGHTRVKAILSASVVDILEAEIEGKVSLETKNDVFTIREATVVSTPYGPSDGFVQLLIHDIEYQYHLRKTIGKPIPIEERAETSKLIGEVLGLRIKQFPREETPPPPQPQTQETPRSQPSVGSQRASRVFEEQSPTTQVSFATQVPVRKKAHTQSPSQGGSMINGVNLPRPLERNASPTETAAPGQSSSNGTTKLLSLLGKRKASPPPPRPKVARHSYSPVVEEDGQPRRHHTVQGNTPKQSEVTSAPNASPQPVPTMNQPRPIYSRRRIPRDQKNLLDRDLSWFPARLGGRFPCPNIPVSLLEKWNNYAQAKDATPQPEQRTVTRKPLRPANGTAKDDTVEGANNDLNTNEVLNNASEESSSQQSSDEGSLLPWSSSPPRKPVELPPDSSLDNQHRQSPVSRQPLRSQPLDNIGTSGPDTLKRPPNRPQSYAPSQIASSSPHSSPKSTNGHFMQPPSSILPRESRPGFRDDQRSSGFHVPRVPQFHEVNRTENVPNWRSSPSNHSPGADSDRRRRPSFEHDAYFSLRHGAVDSYRPAPRQYDDYLPRRSSFDRTRRTSPTRYIPDTTLPKRPPGPLPDLYPPAYTPTGAQRYSQTYSAPSRHINGRADVSPTNATQLSSNRTPKYSRNVLTSDPDRSEQSDGAGDGDGRPAKTSRTAPDYPLNSSPEGHMRPPPKPEKQVDAPPSNTSTSVVKGTQLDDQGVADDMEMSVPRSLVEDPSLAHRRRRTQHYKGLQRRNWIQKNCVLDERAKFDFWAIYKAYKAAQPKDAVAPSELSQAIDDVFPAPEGSERGGLRLLSSSPRPANVLSASRSPSSTANDAAVAEASRPMTVHPILMGEPEGALPNEKVNSMEHSSAASLRHSPVIEVSTAPPSSRRQLPWIQASMSSAKKTPVILNGIERPVFRLPCGLEQSSPTAELEQPSAAVEPNYQASPPSDEHAEDRDSPQSPDHANDAALLEPSVAESANPGLIHEQLPQDITEKRQRSSHPTTVFDEFVHAWQNIRPRGAFARPEEKANGKERKRQKERLNVLAWEL